jgi:hypothetical protein
MNSIDHKSKPDTKSQELGLKTVFDLIHHSYNSELIENLELQYIYVTKLHLNCKLMSCYMTKASWADADSEDQDPVLEKSDEEEICQEAQELDIVKTLKGNFDVSFIVFLMVNIIDPRCQ